MGLATKSMLSKKDKVKNGWRKGVLSIPCYICVYINIHVSSESLRWVTAGLDPCPVAGAAYPALLSCRLQHAVITLKTEQLALNQLFGLSWHRQHRAETLGKQEGDWFAHRKPHLSVCVSTADFRACCFPASVINFYDKSNWTPKQWPFLARVAMPVCRCGASRTSKGFWAGTLTCLLYGLSPAREVRCGCSDQ